jgi:hypothetical protein
MWHNKKDINEQSADAFIDASMTPFRSLKNQSKYSADRWLMREELVVDH